jgi:hypothetical protein
LFGTPSVPGAAVHEVGDLATRPDGGDGRVLGVGVAEVYGDDDGLRAAGDVGAAPIEAAVGTLAVCARPESAADPVLKGWNWPRNGAAGLVEREEGGAGLLG